MKISEKTKRNYKSDLNHFFGWLESTQSSVIQSAITPALFAESLTSAILISYVRALICDNAPIASINRRLSTLRVFFRCAEIQEWSTNNPTKDITNLITKTSHPSNETVMCAYRDKLSAQLLDQDAVREHISDAVDFLDWIVQKGKTTQL